MDVSASFQFLVDELRLDWHVIAPDWRGFGLTQWADGGYWFPDYYADLDTLLEIYQPATPVNLVGHSMGGLIACTYSGIRPQRVRRLVSLEGFGLARTTPEDAPPRYERWLNELRQPPGFKPYASFEEVEARLKKTNPRLKDEYAHFLARHWARETPDGTVALRSDPRHKRVNPVLSRIEELLACWRRITCPTLWVIGAQSKAGAWTKDSPDQFAQRKAAFMDFREASVDNCGHMMHHDQPARVSALIEAHIRG